MKKSDESTTKYHFKSTSSIDGTLKHYVSSKRLKSTGHYKIYDSYISNVIDLNKIKQQALLVHFHTINKAIKYAKLQIEHGQCEKAHLPLPELHKSYWHRVYQAALRQIKLEQSGYTSKESFEASQPYWIDQNAIVTYGFREDKNLKSKFQAFVEFVNANKNYGTIKLNLQMSKSAYKHIDEIYMDGFDLVKNDKSFSVRHIKQSLIKAKESTGIDKLLFVDKWLNMYTIEVDKTALGEHGYMYYDEEKKTVNGFIYKSHKTSAIAKLLMKLTSKVSPEKYQDILHRFEMSLKARLSQEIGSNNEDNITLLLPRYHHKTANNINTMVGRITKDLCMRKGLKLGVIIEDDDKINKVVEQHKKQHLSKQNIKLSSHTKWQEYAYALMLFKYKGFYPYLRKSRKSSVKISYTIPQKDVEELTNEELDKLEHDLCNYIFIKKDDSKANELLDRLRSVRNDRLEKAKAQQRLSEADKLRDYQYRRGLELGFWASLQEFYSTMSEKEYVEVKEDTYQERQLEFV